jgi:DNA polymerase-3 subunit beta
MKITIPKETLVKALELIAPITDKSSSKPILSNFLLRAVPESGGEPAHVELSATDYEISVTGKFPAQVEEQGTVCISARRALEICREFLTDQVAMNTDAQMWTIISETQGGTRLRLPSVDVGLYPQMERSELPNGFKLNSKELKRCIELTKFATQTNETRKNLTGVCIRIGEGDAKFIATDGHRLAQVVKMVEIVKAKQPTEIIVPRRALEESEKVLGRAEGDVEVAFDERMLMLTAGSVVLMTRLVEGKFPNVDPVIPRDSDKVVRVQRERMINALRKVSVMSSDKIKPVKLSLAPGEIHLETERAEYGDVEDKFPAEYDGEEFNIGFNARYLQDVLSVASHAEHVEFHLKGALNPCLIKVPGDSSFLSVVMPLRIEW